MFNTRETNELETALATAERERDAAIAENAALKKRCEWLRAAHMLLAQDEVFVRAPTQPGFINMASATVVDGEPAIYVLCSDTFAYACADAEEATYADATELLRIGVSEGWPGLVRWVQARRHEKGDPCDPIVPVRDRMATIDSMRERAKKAECERDAALAAIEGSEVPPTDEEADALAAQGGAWLYLYRGKHINVWGDPNVIKTEAQACRDGTIADCVWWALDRRHRIVARPSAKVSP
jgi:hypothetical protein